MSDTNTLTLNTYNEGVQRYIESTPQVVSGVFKDWIDGAFEDVPADAGILELGSAFGRDADYIESLGHTVERTDGSVGFVDYLKSQGKSARVLNVVTDEIKAASYDVIFAKAVLLHFNVPELETVLARISKGLRASGLFVFTLKIGDGEEVRIDKLAGERYFHYWTADTIAPLLKVASFDVTQVESSEDQKWLHIIAKKETV